MNFGLALEHQSNLIVFKYDWICHILLSLNTISDFIRFAEERWCLCGLETDSFNGSATVDHEPSSSYTINVYIDTFDLFYQAMVHNKNDKCLEINQVLKLFKSNSKNFFSFTLRENEASNRSILLVSKALDI